VLFLLAIVTLSSSFIIYGESGTGVVFFTLREALPAAILLVASAAMWYA
jgi:hypothetical protein